MSLIFIHAYARMEETYLKALCRQDKLYETPELNDVLYLHFKGINSFEKIYNIKKEKLIHQILILSLLYMQGCFYRSVKLVWISGFRRIENLQPYMNLKCLWLQGNCLTTIENLDCLPGLRCLYLQNNKITRIDNLSSLKLLDTLNLAHNCIRKIENLGELYNVLFLDLD